MTQARGSTGSAMLARLSRRWSYYRRIIPAYLTNSASHLTFWHEVPELNPDATLDELGSYYMLFAQKADYAGPFDAEGIPLLDYRGKIGRQYNPIAVAQYGLGNYNLWRRTGDSGRKAKFIAVAEWLSRNLERNRQGCWVWEHHFDWEYRDLLRAPWQSGLAQGQGLSVLVRAHAETGNSLYADAAHRAFQAMLRNVEDGGVLVRDSSNNVWIEEYIVSPATHILNGFIWAAWGVYDYWVATRDPAARALFDATVRTMVDNLPTYDVGRWSLYEHSNTRMKMLASPFYHNLHIVQLRVMYKLTGVESFAEYAKRWEDYRLRWLTRQRVVVYKAIFKLLYY